jgi:hypothetical protein
LDWKLEVVKEENIESDADKVVGFDDCWIVLGIYDLWLQ